MPTAVPYRAIAYAVVFAGLLLAVPPSASACCHGGGGGGGGAVRPTPPAVMPPVIIPGAPPGINEAVTNAVRDATRPAERPPEMRAVPPEPPPEMRAMDPAEVARIEAERAAAEEARHRRAERDIDRWQDWLDTGAGVKLIVGWANNVAGGVAVTACLTGVGCIPVAIYAAGKLIEVVTVSHAEASHGTDFVGRLVNGSATSEERWRRIRINGFGTMASEVLGLPLGPLKDYPVRVSGANAIFQTTMGEAANEAYEGVRDHLIQRSAEIEREREERRQEQIDRAYVEALGFSTSGGFPLPAFPGR